MEILTESTALQNRDVDGEGVAIAGLVISCEHGGNQIPAAYRDLYLAHADLLETHRGYDLGALVMARDLATAFGAPLVTSTVSRLLVDLNRSVGHRQLYFAATRGAPLALRQQILAEHYQPYRAQAERLVRHALTEHGRVIHISSHSFTPELHGKVRNADIGLLYDPARAEESGLCEHWKASLKACAPDLTVRRNYPYAGKGDGLTARFRQLLPSAAYVGIELEINQKHVVGTSRAWMALRKAIIESLQQALANCSRNNFV